MSNAKAIVMGYVGVLVFASVIYIAGGRIDYPQAHLYVIVALIGTTLNHLLMPKGSNLEAERAAKAHEGEAWDKSLLKLYFLLTLITFVVAGLDSGRFGWSGEVDGRWVGLGVILMLGGQLFFAIAKRENNYFSSTVRIQHERAHAVCDTGVYAHVRHPGYVAMAHTMVAFPLVLGSYWAFIPALLAVAVLVVRTEKEDAFLQANLDGYTEYAQKVKYKLIPYLL